MVTRCQSAVASQPPPWTTGASSRRGRCGKLWDTGLKSLAHRERAVFPRCRLRAVGGETAYPGTCISWRAPSRPARPPGELWAAGRRWRQMAGGRWKLPGAGRPGCRGRRALRAHRGPGAGLTLPPYFPFHSGSTPTWTHDTRNLSSREGEGPARVGT